MLDLGIYCIQFFQFVFKKEPKSIKAEGLLNDDGVDLVATAEINYGDNKVGKMKTSIIETLSNTAKINGTKGTMTVSGDLLKITVTYFNKLIAFF